MEDVSGFEPTSDITELGYLKLVTVSSFCPFNHFVDATGGVCHQLDLLGTDLHAICCGGSVKNTMCSKNHTGFVKFKLVTVSLLAIMYTSELCVDASPHIIVDLRYWA